MYVHYKTDKRPNYLPIVFCQYRLPVRATINGQCGMADAMHPLSGPSPIGQQKAIFGSSV